MKKYILILSIVSVSALIFSCNSKEDKQKIASIDQMLNDCNTIKNNLTTEFMDSVKEYHNLVKESISKLEKAYNIDNSFNNEVLMKCYYDLTSANKILKNYHKKHVPKINQDIDLLIKQLSNLKMDIKSNAITDSLKAVYYQSEDSVYSFLKQVADTRIQYSRDYMEKFEKNKETIEKLLKEAQK